MISVLMITGVLPPNVCGVGDYTQNILNTECAKSWQTFTTSNWALNRTYKIIRKINTINPDIIFMQYPAEGYGWSLVPHILMLYFSCMKKKIFVTVLHEYSSFKPKARFFINNILYRSTKIIFTTDYELKKFSQKRPAIKNKSFVVPILSNIPIPKIIKPISNRTIDILYFGHIRPNKGIEDYLRVVKEIMLESPGVRIKMIGQVPKGYESYLNELEYLLPGFMDFTLLNANTDLLLQTLGEAKICFLPFPDGLSERRGSFLASTQSGSVVVSYPGPFLTNRLKDAFIPVNKGSESGEILQILSNTDLLSTQQNKSLAYHIGSPFGDWNDIAKEYLKIATIPLIYK